MAQITSEYDARTLASRAALQWLALRLGLPALTSMLKHNVTHILMRMGPRRRLDYGYRMTSDVARLSLEKYRKRIEPELLIGVREQLDCEFGTLLIEL